MAFVSAVNLGDEPRDHFTGRFLLAEGDEDKPVEGLPGLPPGYTEFLRTERLEVGVESVESERVERETGCYWEFRLALDRGLDDGIGPGVRLRRLPPPRFYPDVTVISATDANAIGIMRTLCDRGSARPDTSMRFTTGAMGRPTREPVEEDGCRYQEE